jgi:hypothetical protein
MQESSGLQVGQEVFAFMDTKPNYRRSYLERYANYVTITLINNVCFAHPTLDPISQFLD